MSNSPAAAQTRVTPVVEVTMDFAKEEILLGMFYRFSGSRPGLQDRLESAYRKKYGVDMMEQVEMDQIRPVYLEGPPGHGKTMTHQSAAREFANLMGMRFIKDPTLAMMQQGEIGLNDFVYTTIELGGETSNKEVAGLMTKMKVEMPDGTKVDFMGHLPDWRLAATTVAGFAYVLFDDFPTASHQVQNAMLGTLLGGGPGKVEIGLKELAAAQRRVENGETILSIGSDSVTQMRESASSVAMGAAGNQGARDGNVTNMPTTAIFSRFARMHVTDNLESFANRANSARNDAIGDAGIVGFLTRNPDCFYQLAVKEQGQIGQSAVSRTWDAVMTRMRIIFHNAGGMDGLAKMHADQTAGLLSEITQVAASHVGKDPAKKMAAYYLEMLVGATPVAQQIVVRGEVDKEVLKRKYNQGGSKSASHMDFGYSLSSSLASFAATEIARVVGKNPSKKLLNELSDLNTEPAIKLRTAIRNFSYGVCQLDDGPLRSFALNQMTQRLSAQAPSLFLQHGKYNIPTPETAYLLSYAFFVDNKAHARPDLQGEFTDQLSQMGGFSDLDSITKSADFAKKVKALQSKSAGAP